MTIDAIHAPFTHFPTLTTERLRLRRVEPRDIEALFAIYSDAETMRYFGHEPYQSREEVEETLRLREEDYTARRAIRWGIALKQSDILIGNCSFHHFDEGHFRAETGYVLDRAYWGQGIMSEAVAAIISYGFGKMGLRRIEAIIDIANERSKGVLLKLGFQYEGNLRQRYHIGDHFEDEHYFGLLRDEWLARQNDHTR